jgi:hypothetical protein
MTEPSHIWPDLKHRLKLGRWQVRRGLVALRWGSQSLAKTPSVLGNAMPKSGSHLIIQVLQGLVDVGPFVNPGFPPVNRTEDNRKLPEAAMLENLRRMRPGDIAYGYVQARPEYIRELTRSGKSSVFVYRDPRDMIVSHVFYATEMNDQHGMHVYYSEKVTNLEERINAAIQGVAEKDAGLSSVKTKYENYLGWLEVPEILSLRFEDLILDQDRALARILEYLSTRGFESMVSQKMAVERLKRAVAPSRSGTFRRGKPGNWREYFTQGNKDRFKDVAGDLLLRLGYEENNAW